LTPRPAKDKIHNITADLSLRSASMEKTRKNQIMLGVIIVCLIVAAGVTLITRRRSGIPKRFAGVQIWVKCRDCGAAWQISKKHYFEYQEKHDDPQKAGAPAMPCKECGHKSAYRAVKCEKCGEVFEYGSRPGKFFDRCPKCGYSKMAVERGAEPAP
jgi:ribosomal protein S27E